MMQKLYPCTLSEDCYVKLVSNRPIALDKTFLPTLHKENTGPL